MKRALFIAGPTAGGKSALSLALARRLNGVVINADSMQVYRDLPILTACPTPEEQGAVPHRLYQFLDGAEVCSVTLWMEHAMREANICWDSGQTPIFVGGTGLYFKMLTEGIAKIPPIPDDIRQKVRDECEHHGSELLHAELEAVDPETANRLPPGDSQRISRAIEVFRATNRPISEWHKETKPGPLSDLEDAGAIQKYVLLPERDLLYERCNQRFDSMVERGVLDEVRSLMNRDLSSSLPVMRALGVPSLIQFLRNEVTLETAVEDAKMQTRRFAKRQMTWFRNQFSQWDILVAQYSESDLVKLINKIIKK